MSIRVQISEGPLGHRLLDVTGAGAGLVFDGIVRPAEGETAIRGLHYQVYEPMATKMLSEIAHDVLDRHGLLAIDVEHSRGDVPVGAISFRLQIASVHRKEALRAMDEFIDRMKQDVPIWKSPIVCEVHS